MDADFAGGWQQTDSSDTENIISRTVMVIMYAKCPIYWRSSTQTEIALSTAKAEYVALSSALREVLQLMTMMEEINKVFPILIQKPKFVCQVYEENKYCIKWLLRLNFPHEPNTSH